MFQGPTFRGWGGGFLSFVPVLGLVRVDGKLSYTEESIQAVSTKTKHFQLVFFNDIIISIGSKMVYTEN